MNTDPMSLEAWRQVKPALRNMMQRVAVYLDENGPHTWLSEGGRKTYLEIRRGKDAGGA